MKTKLIVTFLFSTNYIHQTALNILNEIPTTNYGQMRWALKISKVQSWMQEKTNAIQLKHIQLLQISTSNSSNVTSKLRMSSKSTQVLLSRVSIYNINLCPELFSNTSFILCI